MVVGDDQDQGQPFHSRLVYRFMEGPCGRAAFAKAGGPDSSGDAFEAMRQQGRTCEFLLYEDEGHGFARIENLFDANRKIVAFLDRELRKAK